MTLTKSRENCLRKRTFVTEIAAKRKAKRNHKKKLAGYTNWSYYRCKECGLYHLTTQDDPRSKRARARRRKQRRRETLK